MHKSLQNRYNRLQSAKNNILQLASTIEESKQNKQPKEGAWSVNQIIYHLMNAEKGTVAYINKKKLGIKEIQNTNLATTFRYFILLSSLILPIKWKAPAVVSYAPENLNLQDLIAEWEKVRAEMQTLLTEIEPNHLNKELFKHPLAGRLNIKQTLGFMYHHINHHYKQVERTISALN